jgi:hypothetical protein
MAIQRLTAAYRSRSRPSSTLGAKASTMCPYYLDGDLGISDEIPLGEAFRLRPVIPVSLATVQFSRSEKRRSPSARARDREVGERRRTSRSLKTQQHAGRNTAGARPATCDLSGPVDIARAIARGDRCPIGLPRKEVIQPQLPLRLPCYDFTPVASPTFDGSLPKGLGHRLRVLLTPMV